MPRPFARLLMFALLATPILTVSAQDVSTTALIRVQITGLHSDQGQVGCLLYSAADGFPSQPEKAVEKVFAPIKERTASCQFTAVKPGTYAIVAMHDENENNKLDRTLIGKPSEGVAASRAARPGFMRGPRFEDAVMHFGVGTATVQIAIHYY